MTATLGKIDAGDCVESFWKLLSWIQSAENTKRVLVVFRRLRFPPFCNATERGTTLAACRMTGQLTPLGPKGTFGIDMPDMFNHAESKGLAGCFARNDRGEPLIWRMLHEAAPLKQFMGEREFNELDTVDGYIQPGNAVPVSIRAHDRVLGHR